MNHTSIPVGNKQLISNRYTIKKIKGTCSTLASNVSTAILLSGDESSSHQLSSISQFCSTTFTKATPCCFLTVRCLKLWSSMPFKMVLTLVRKEEINHLSLNNKRFHIQDQNIKYIRHPTRRGGSCHMCCGKDASMGNLSSISENQETNI